MDYSKRELVKHKIPYSRLAFYMKLIINNIIKINVEGKVSKTPVDLNQSTKGNTNLAKAMKE